MTLAIHRLILSPSSTLAAPPRLLLRHDSATRLPVNSLLLQCHQRRQTHGGGGVKFQAGEQAAVLLNPSLRLRGIDDNISSTSFSKRFRSRRSISSSSESTPPEDDHDPDQYKPQAAKKDENENKNEEEENVRLTTEKDNEDDKEAKKSSRLTPIKIFIIYTVALGAFVMWWSLSTKQVQELRLYDPSFHENTASLVRYSGRVQRTMKRNSEAILNAFAKLAWKLMGVDLIMSALDPMLVELLPWSLILLFMLVCVLVMNLALLSLGLFVAAMSMLLMLIKYGYRSCGRRAGVGAHMFVFSLATMVLVPLMF
ncbi:hypothetical protein LINGRAHAP2_LOCUS12331 [Linum grandiflorum]